MQNDLRQWISLCEAYQAGGYSAEVWRRWWGNLLTGELIPVDLREDHDAFLFDHLDDFFTASELANLPDPENFELEFDADPNSPIQNNRDAILMAAYDKGWQAILYDANNHSLSLRTGSNQADLRAIRKIVRKITNELSVLLLVMEIGDQDYRLDSDEIERFIKFGRLPPR